MASFLANNAVCNIISCRRNISLCGEKQCGVKACREERDISVKWQACTAHILATPHGWLYTDAARGAVRGRKIAEKYACIPFQRSHATTSAFFPRPSPLPTTTTNTPYRCRAARYARACCPVSRVDPWFSSRYSFILISVNSYSRLLWLSGVGGWLYCCSALPVYLPPLALLHRRCYRRLCTTAAVPVLPMFVGMRAAVTGDALPTRAAPTPSLYVTDTHAYARYCAYLRRRAQPWRCCTLLLYLAWPRARSALYTTTATTHATPPRSAAGAPTVCYATAAHWCLVRYLPPTYLPSRLVWRRRLTARTYTHCAYHHTLRTPARPYPPPAAPRILPTLAATFCSMPGDRLASVELIRYKRIIRSPFSGS